MWLSRFAMVLRGRQGSVYKESPRRITSMSKIKRKCYVIEFKARVVLGALKGEQILLGFGGCFDE